MYISIFFKFLLFNFLKFLTLATEDMNFYRLMNKDSIIIIIVVVRI